MLKQEKSEEYLRFGQIIRIHGHKCLQNIGDQEELRGMITVKGFTDKDAKYTTFSSFKHCKFYRQSLFQILPRGKFDKAESRQQQNRIMSDFKALAASKAGEFVKFGQDVVFQHVDSHDYLSGSVRCSDGGLGAFKVQLFPTLTKDLVFKLEPFHSFQKEGDKIKLESPLRIKNISNRCFISTEKNSFDKYNIVTTYSRSFTWLIHLHESHDTLADKDQVRTHDLLFLIHTQNDGYLCIQQKNSSPTITLPLQQTGHPFFTSIWEIEKLPIPQISPYNKKQDMHKLGTENTYTLRQLLNQEYLQVAAMNATATISDENDQEEEKLDPFEITIKSAKGLPNISQYLKNKGLIKIGGPKCMEEGQIDANEITKIDKQRLKIRKQYPFIIKTIKFSSTESSHAFRIQKLDEQSKNQVLFILSTYEVLDDFKELLAYPTEQFEAKVKFKQLQHIDLTLQKLIAFIKNCSMNDIEAELLPIKKLQYVCMDLKICTKLFTIVSQIGQKILEEIYKGSKGENEALKTVFNRAYYLILQIIRNNPITKIYVCEEWFQIIINHAIQLEEDNVHLTLNQILQNNDELVNQFLKRDDNYLVKRILNIFNLKPPHQKFLSIFSASCVSGNLPIVINQDIIQNQFLANLDDMSKFTFRYTIEDNIPFHQSMEQQEALPIKPKIKEIFIESYISKAHYDTRRLKYFFQESGRIDLYQTSNYFIAYLNLLADICYGKNTKARTYIEQNLQPKRKMDDEAIQLLQKPTILDVLIAILQDNQLNSSDVKGNINLQRAVLRLITFAYIESASENPVLRINRYRNLDAMQQNVVAKQQKFNDILQFIKTELKAFKSFYSPNLPPIANPNDPQEKKQRQIQSLQIKMRLYTILDLLRSTLINGYWSIEKQQNQILLLLLKILKNVKEDILHQRQDTQLQAQELKKEFFKFKNEVSMATPTIEKIIECKALACQLIQIIFDFRFNSLVTQSVSFYKDLLLQKKQNIISSHKIAIDIARLKSDAKTEILYNSDLWEQKLSKILDNKQSSGYEQMKNAVYYLIPLMVELSIHKDSRLFFRSLKILKRHFYSSTDIKNLLLSLSLFDNENGQYLALQIMNKRKKLNKLQEQGQLYIKDNAKQKNLQNPYKQIKKFLIWLSEAIKRDADLQAQLKSYKYHSIFQHFNQESRINKFHQRLIKNMDLHPILLKFIGLSKRHLLTFNLDAKQILKYVYRFLTLLARNFKEAKKQMVHMIDKIKTHAQQQCVSMIEAHYNPRSLYMVNQMTINYQNIGIHNQEALQILRQRNDCEAILLLGQLFTDNKDILYNQTIMEKIIKQIVQMVNEVRIQFYYKSHLLDFFRSIIYYNDKHISINQSRILAKLQDNQKKNIYYMFDKMDRITNEDRKGIVDLIEEWKMHNTQLLAIADPKQKWPLARNEEQPVIILQELTYFITMMNLFSNLVEGKQTVNIGKCRQVHSYATLMHILEHSSLCYPLKAHLRNYINQLYYSTWIEEDLCVDIIKMELPVMISDLNTIIVILCKERMGRYYILHPIRYKYFQSYIYLYIEQIAYSLNYLLNDTTFKKEIQKQLDTNYPKSKYYLHYFILRIYERLRFILTYYYDHKYLRGFLNKITNIIKKQFIIYFKQNALFIFDKSQEKLHDPQEAGNTEQPKKINMNQDRIDSLTKRSTKLVHKLVQADIKNYFTQARIEKDKNYPLVFFLPYDEEIQKIKQKEQSGQEKQEQERRLAQKLRMMLFSKDRKRQQRKGDAHSTKLSTLSAQLHSKHKFNLFMNTFIDKACQDLYEVDKFSENEYKFKEKFVSFEEYIRIFVQVNTISPSQIPTELKIFFFSILLQYIVQQNKDPSVKLKEIQLWTKNDYQEFKGAIKEAQLFLKKANVAELLVQTLKNTEDLNLILGILQFGIAYLLGGNTQCQNSLLQKVKLDKKNQLFIKIQKIITKLGRKISSKIAQRTSVKIPKSDQFIVQALDRYDYFEISTKSLRRYGNFEQQKDQIDEEKLQKKVFGCLFKFMQLLCECNNIQFKNFIRQQVDMDGSKKNATFNILNMTTFQIRRLFKVMDREASLIILPLTDFLNEVVSLPCLANQLSLCQTTFFEDLCYMASFFNDKDNLKERGFNTHESEERLFELYQKCILVILNILQGNNSELNKSFLNKLDVLFLLRLIEKYFEQLKIKTDEDLIRLLEDKNIQTQHVPYQLENAMNVMVVLLKLEASEGAEAFIEKKKNYMAESLKNGFNLAKLLEALKGEIEKIEIVSTEDKQYIYFPKHPILTKLSDATRNRIMEEVTRQTQREKIKSLLEFKDQIFAQIKHNFRIQKQSFIGIQISPARIHWLQSILFNLSYFIICFWSITTNVIIEYGQVQYQSPRHIKPILKTLDITQLLVTILYSILYYKCKFALAKYRHQKIEQQEEEGQKKKKSLDMAQKEQQVKSGISYTLGRVAGGALKIITNNPITILWNNDEKFSNVVFYFLTSLFGTFYDQKIFMFFILFYFMKNETLENVFKAITFNIGQLLSVGMLGLVFAYIFCLIFYETYALQLIAESDPGQTCQTIVYCILDLYVSGTIGGSVQKLEFVRFCADLIYFVFFGLLFQNIVSGIMIDTFAQRRASREQMTNDKKNKCYICGRNRGELQKNDEQFSDHITQKHFLWNYIYYLYCLQKKNQTEYTGVQYQIQVCVDAGVNDQKYIKWIPFGGDESDPHAEKVLALSELMEQLNIDTKKRISSIANLSSSKSEQKEQAN